MIENPTNPASGIDEQKTLALFAEGTHTIAEIARALGCNIAELAAWRATRPHGKDVRNIEKLYEQSARLLLARLSETLVTQGAAIALGSVEATETQRKMCVDLIRVCLAPRRPRGVPRWSSTSSSARARTHRPRPQAAPATSAAQAIKRQLVGLEPYPDDDDRGPEDRGQRVSMEAIYDALQTIGEESMRRTIAERKAYNDFVSDHPELGWAPIHVPSEWEGGDGASDDGNDSARPPPGER